MSDEILFSDEQEETLLDTNSNEETLLDTDQEETLLDTNSNEETLLDTSEETIPLNTEQPTSEEELISLHQDEKEISTKDIGKIKTKVKFSLKSKIAIAIAILLTASLLLLSITILNNEKKELLNEMRYRAQIISKNFSANLKETIDNDMDRHPIVEETAKIKDLVKIIVMDSHYRVIDSSDLTLWQKIILKNARGEPLSKINHRIQKKLNGLVQMVMEESPTYLTIFQPILFGQAKLGYIILKFTKKPILSKIHKIETKIRIFIIVSILLGIIISYFLISFLLSPIKKLTYGVRRIGTGDLKYKIELNTKDELEMLGTEFNDMTTKLNEAQKQIVEKGKLEEQIHIAEDLQRNLLPETFPQSPYFSFDAYYKAARGVGGDYYDILQVSDDTIGTVIADVSGKGVPAAIIMVVIRTIFQSVAKFLKFPDKALHTINQDISGRTSGEKYATMFYYMYNFENGILTFSNGGHNPLLVYHKKLNQVREYDTEGAPVGVMKETQYEKRAIQLDEGDIIFLNTDGITEAENINHEFFDETMFNAAIVKYASVAKNATEIKNHIMSDIEKFVGSAPQHDDMTLLVFKINKIPNKGVIKERSVQKQPTESTQKNSTQKLHPQTGLKEKVKYVYDNPTDIYRSLV